MRSVAAVVLAAGLAGCASLDRYERTYAVSYDADTRSGSISLTLKPASPSASVERVPLMAMDDATIDKLVKLLTTRTTALDIVREQPALAAK